jgi:hypothetical protein
MANVSGCCQMRQVGDLCDRIAGPKAMESLGEVRFNYLDMTSGDAEQEGQEE